MQNPSYHVPESILGNPCTSDNLLHQKFKDDKKLNEEHEIEETKPTSQKLLTKLTQQGYRFNQLTIKMT